MRKWMILLAAAILVVSAISTLVILAMKATASSDLLEASKLGNDTEVLAYLNRGISVDSRDPDIKVTPLIAASTYGHASTVKLLLDYGAQINSVDLGGDTALSMAVANNYPDVVNLLLTRGANVNTKNEDGETPLATAERMNNKHILLLLKSFKKK